MKTRHAVLTVLLLGFAPALDGCRAAKAKGVYSPAASAPPATWADVFEAASDVDVEVVVSATWEGNLSGLLDLEDPKAVAAGKTDEKYPIVLPVGVIRHASRGDFVVDSGVERASAEGKKGAVRGLGRSFLKTLEPKKSLGEIIDEKDLDLTAVLLTHHHPDHVLGLPDVGTETPVVVGPGELDNKYFMYFFIKGSYRRLLGVRNIQEIDPSLGMKIEHIEQAYDLLGDGSIWGIYSPGHTPGSMAYLVNAKSGPVLFVGDTSHTIWGWENGVTPGKFTEDHEKNVKSLKALKKLVEEYPQIQVVLGHELYEEGKLTAETSEPSEPEPASSEDEADSDSE